MVNIGAVVLVVVGSLGLIGCDSIRQAGNATTMSELKRFEIQAKHNRDIQAAQLDFQGKVIKACTEKGGVPEIVNNNITCRKF